jgi:hypothetical protein
MKEQLCLRARYGSEGGAELWWEGTESLVDPGDFNLIADFFKQVRGTPSFFHSHPLGHCNLSEMDIESLTGWRFCLNRDFYFYLISGVSIKKFSVEWDGEGDIEINKVKAGASPSGFFEFDKLVLEVIKRSEYV